MIQRELVIAALGGLTGALPARVEEHSGKMSQIADVSEHAKVACSVAPSASLFIRPRSCKVVSGGISPTGWSKFFDLLD